jgi:hypothetical protein
VYNGAHPGGPIEIPPEEHTEENEMKKSLLVLGVTALVIVAASMGFAQAKKASSMKRRA